MWEQVLVQNEAARRLWRKAIWQVRKARRLRYKALGPIDKGGGQLFRNTRTGFLWYAVYMNLDRRGILP